MSLAEDPSRCMKARYKAIEKDLNPKEGLKTKNRQTSLSFATLAESHATYKPQGKWETLTTKHQWWNARAISERTFDHKQNKASVWVLMIVFLSVWLRTQESRTIPTCSRSSETPTSFAILKIRKDLTVCFCTLKNIMRAKTMSYCVYRVSEIC